MASTNQNDDLHVVVMFEYDHGKEELTPSDQVNEVFGPFDSGEEATAWADRARLLIEGRNWLIIPLSAASSINAVDPMVN